LAGLATDLVRRQVAVIITMGGELSALAAKAATSSSAVLATTNLLDLLVQEPPCLRAGRLAARLSQRAFLIDTDIRCALLLSQRKQNM
jgi:hypothetical protein